MEQVLKPRRGRRMGTAAKSGEVVQVHGGHIIRSTAGKKDRHSKVYTAKGPRDRRVRLAAHTAIQFYDVQDRLGYDRPSKAVDWLMEKAKHAIDNLARLPPFDPNVAVNHEPDLTATEQPQPAPQAGLGLEDQSMRFDSGYPHRDLCLSLQSFQNGDGFEPETTFPAGFGGGVGWSSEMGRFSRLLAWSGDGGGAVEGVGGGERGTHFRPQPSSIRAWDDIPMGRTIDHQLEQHHQAGIGVLGSDGFMGFSVGEEVHGLMVAHQHHGASSMSTTTDSSH